MKLLFDHNLSPRLVSRLADLYPDASHTSLTGLDRATDNAVWLYAQAHAYVIVTKDADFNDVSVLRGFPPMVAQKLVAQQYADRMLSNVIRPGITFTVSIKARQRIGATGLKVCPQDILNHRVTSVACSIHCIA